MLRTLFVLLAAVIPICAAAQTCDEWYEYDDGTLPVDFIISGDPGEPGALAVHDEVLVHSQPGAVHYVSSMCGGPPRADRVYFDVKRAYWDFAWQIMWYPDSGRCLRLSHDDSSGEWGYSFSEFSWWSIDPSTCPDCQWMWHNGTALRTVFYPTGGPAEGWHRVGIIDVPYHGSVRISIDDEVILEETYELVIEEGAEGGTFGFGCSGGSVGTPAFDNLYCEWDSPVEAGTWGEIKALYR